MIPLLIPFTDGTLYLQCYILALLIPASFRVRIRRGCVNQPQWVSVRHQHIKDVCGTEPATARRLRRPWLRRSPPPTNHCALKYNASCVFINGCLGWHHV